VADTEKNNTLSEPTIARLLGSQGSEIENNGDCRQSPETTAPERQNCAHVTAKETEIGLEVGNASRALGSGVGPTSQRAKILLVVVLFVVLLFVLNRFHGVPAFESRWLSLTTYRTILDDFVELGVSATDGRAKRQVRLKVKGIAYSLDRPSAVVESAIVHQGDRVSGANVVKISRDSIEFEANGETWIQRVQ
jgi:hypothetical protein